MKPTLSRLCLALLAAGAASTAQAAVPIDTIGGSEISFEGLVQADGNWFDNDVQDLNGDGGNGRDSEFELRRAELVLKGKGPGNIDWVVGYDAKADKYLDVNARYRFAGNGGFLQLGQYKQPIGLEELSSSRTNDFISKATVTNTFATSRRLGVAAGYGNADWSITGSVFGRELTRNQAHGSGYALRGTWAPVNTDGHVVHLGLAYASNDTDADTLRLRARPNADLASVRLVDTGTLADTDRIGTFGVEGMWIRGPFKLQGEYFSVDVDRYGDSGDFSGDGGYVSGLWNLSGETWSYRSGVPNTASPDTPSRGLWQLGLRYDTLDLDDGRLAAGAPGAGPRVDGVLGGKQDIWTAGVNWYWRSNFKFALNYVMVDSSRYSSSAGRVVDDNPDILEVRAQFHW